MAECERYEVQAPPILKGMKFCNKATARAAIDLAEAIEHQTAKLKAAQLCLEQIWPLLNTLQNDAPIGNAAQKMIADVKKTCAPLYETAMGDR